MLLFSIIKRYYASIITHTPVTDGITKKIRSITDEEGNEFDVEIEESEYELFFVQGFTCRWDKKNALVMDVQLKYGPDTPDVRLTM